MSGFTTGAANVRERLQRLRLAEDRIAVPQRQPHTRLDARGLTGPTLPEFSRLIRSIAGSIAKRPTSVVVTGPDEDAPARAEAAMHLAAGLAGHAYRVVVVDTDFATPGLGGLIPDPTLEGVIDMLRFGRSCRAVLVPAAPGGPELLPAGSFPLETPLAFDLDTLRGLAHRVSVHCDVAVFVCPLAIGNQVNGLIQVCDSVIYATRVRPGGLGRIEGPLGELERHGVLIAGAVVYVEPEPAPLSVTFPPPVTPEIPEPRPQPTAAKEPVAAPEPIWEQPVAPSISSFPSSEAIETPATEPEPVREAEPEPESAPHEVFNQTEAPGTFEIRLPPHPVPDEGVAPEPADTWSSPPARGPLEYETDDWRGPDRRAPAPPPAEIQGLERADELELEDAEFAYEDSGRYSRTPLLLLFTLLVLIGGFLGWALWTKRGMERQVGKEWGAEGSALPENATPDKSGSTDLDDGAAAQAVGGLPETSVAEPHGGGPTPQTPANDGTMRAADQQASSNSTFVAVGGQRLGTSPQPSDQSASEPAPGKGAAEHDADDAELEAVPVPPPPAPSGSGTTTANPAADASSNGALEPAPASSPAVAAPDVREKAEQAAPESELPYTLHVGSYRTIEKAYEDIANLQKRGFEGRAVRTDLGSKGVWYRVYVGAYPTRAEALATSRLILELPEYKYAQVVRVPRQ